MKIALLYICSFTLFSCSLLNEAIALPLSHFGAVGDGITNDTVAIRKAISSDSIELDGEGKSYRVIGTLEINRDIRLKNVKFFQGEKEIPSAILKENHPRFREKLYTRTLWIRKRNSDKKLKIQLDNIYIHRGTDETQGLPSDNAAIWLDGTEGELRNIEITGHGSGMGIMIVNSSRILLDQIHIHDMIWKPWKSKPQLDYSVVSKNWNGILSWELSKEGKEVFPGIYFDWKRIQERIAGINAVRSNNITIQNSSIDRLLARFKNGKLEAYQTDGITIGSFTRNILIMNVRVGQVWEGIDLTGNPLTDAVIENSQVTDAHAFGFKMANGARKVILKNNFAIRCGLSGFVVSGKNNPGHTNPASGDITIRNCVSKNSGSNGYWQDQAMIAGYRIMKGRIESPSNVRILNSKAIDNKVHKTMSFGFHSEFAGNPPNTVNQVESTGHIREAVSGFEVLE
jgi:hypothetical protein